MRIVCWGIILSAVCVQAYGAESANPESPAHPAFKELSTEAWAKIIPPDKDLSEAWVQSLFERGRPRSHEGEALMNIGMPVGGLCTGLIYLGGDGRLWNWDIFNRPLSGVKPRRVQYKGRSWHGLPPGLDVWQGGNYVEPVRDQPSPFEQGFALQLTVDGKQQIRTLDRNGWGNVVFTGAYPFGTVHYSDPECPVKVTLEAYSPFCPLDFDDSSHPATIMRYRVENAGRQAVEVEIGGWLENPVMLDSAREFPGLTRVNSVVSKDGLAMVFSRAACPPAEAKVNPDIIFDDFEKPAYDGWTVEGDAFGDGPLVARNAPSYMGDLNIRGARAVNSHATAPCDPFIASDAGAASPARDAATGTLASRPFTIERKFITFLVGGGAGDQTAVRLLVDGQVAQSVSGHNSTAMRPAFFDVTALAGRTARIEVIDQATSGWGHIGVDHIVFTDEVEKKTPEECPDWGSMALAAIGGAAGRASARLDPDPKQSVFADNGPATASSSFDRPLLGGATHSLTLAPGATGTAEFVLAWHFTNIKEAVKGAGTGLYYGKRFKDAAEVAGHVAANAGRLDEVTRLWNTTWYDSTLPYWFLERTFIPQDCLASTTCFRFADGRFYTYEGVRSCPGHPNHVWHYAQGHARLFPELEQDVIERVWYGFGFRPDGSMAYRGEVAGESAIDGHCGVILSVLRAHQTNPDDAMLRRLWPRVKKSIQFAISCDRDNDGLLDTPMLTTLDEPWHGEIPWISSLYIAALKAGEQMALDMGDPGFARECDERAAKGRAAMDAKLFNGEWFVQIPDPANPQTLGAYETVHIDQVLGQAWAWQVGLGRVLGADTTRSALRSIWKYNFSRNLDVFDLQADPKGRPYYTDGEGGVVMTANALGRDVPYGVYSRFACYLNETMNGFEYQVAAHMIAEGMVREGLAIIKTIDERYDGNKRNPFNEVECGDHYARSMAAYGALIAISGFEHVGPRGHIGFAPRLTPENFKVPFTASEGWGTFTQARAGDIQRESIDVKWGTLSIETLAFELPAGSVARHVSVKAADRRVRPREFRQDGSRIIVILPGRVELTAGQSLEVEIR
jgi:non-lysosomal glucosylceramidase